MTPATLTGSGLTKTFNRRVIFKDVTFTLERRNVLRITGRNGSGKSTLVKIIGQTLSPTRGSVALHDGSGEVRFIQSAVGLVSPYLQMYEEFTAVENLSLAMRIRGLKPDHPRIDELLSRVTLFERRHDIVRTYSSGMKQRLKYAFALMHRPSVLLLDEPMANLDAEGMGIVRGIMDEHRSEGILIVATNDPTDIESYDVQIDLNEQS
jgi:heme exporter protein A